MRSYNSYESYRQYRKNRRRYETESSILPIVLLFAILPKILTLIKVLLIGISVVACTYLLYKLLRCKLKKRRNDPPV